MLAAWGRVMRTGVNVASGHFRGGKRGVAPIRVLLGQMPAMHRDILEETLASQSDMMVGGRCDSLEALHDVIDARAPNVTVLGVDRAEWSADFLALLRSHPKLRLLTLAHHARSASLYELQMHRTSIAELPPGAILAAVREDCADGDSVAVVPSARSES